MVTGLSAKEYEERLLGCWNYHHQTDMAQVYKILTDKDSVEKERLFTMANVLGRATRTTEDPLGLRQNNARLEIRKNFFTQRVVSSWNNILCELKSVRTVQAFKNVYRKLRSARVPAGGEQKEYARAGADADDTYDMR